MGTLIFGVGSLAIFNFVEKRARTPMVPLKLFQFVSFSGANERRPKLVTDIPVFPKRLAESWRIGFIEDAAFTKQMAADKEAGSARSGIDGVPAWDSERASCKICYAYS